MDECGSIQSLLLAAAILAGSHVVHGQSAPILYVSQARSVEAFGYDFVGPDPYSVKEAAMASGFGPFDQIVVAGEIAGEAQQTSVLGDSKIVANGYGEGVHYLQAWDSAGKSDFSVEFLLTQPLDFQLAGWVYFGDCCGAEVALMGPGINLMIKGNYAYPWIEFQESGTLVPGKYTLVALGMGAGQSGLVPYGHGEYNFTFEVFVPCYADCDVSGGLDIDDFVCFQTLYAIQDPIADCDASGELDIGDFVCFQTQYAVGC